MINLSDLGLSPEPITAAAAPPASAADPTRATEATGRHPLALEPDSPLARAVFEVWQGRPVTVVKAAPGSGKSTLITRLVSLLLLRTEFTVAVLTPTRSAAFDLAERIGESLQENCGPRTDYACVFGVTKANEFPLRYALASGQAKPETRKVLVRTIASATGLRNPVEADVIIVDESYQATLSDMAVALRKTGQVVLVGDPGQIGPVITVDDTVWAGQKTSPTRRAPELLAERHDAVIIELDTTYRLGPDSTRLLDHLYDFPINCGRSPRHITHRPGIDHTGLRTADGGLPEIVRQVLPDVTDRNDSRYLRSIAEIARSYLGRTVHITTPEDEQTDYTIEAIDICVVAAYRTQVARLTAILDSYKLGRFRVGTADSLQGGQWHVVIAVDPLIGAETAEGHNASPGRLCVMLSRHITHLVWVHDTRWPIVIASTPAREPTRNTSRTVREQLSRFPTINQAGRAARPGTGSIAESHD